MTTENQQEEAPERKKTEIIVDTDHLGPLDAAQIENTVQLFANIVINAWTEIVESEDAGKRAFSFSVAIAGRSIDAKLSGSKKFKYDDEIFIDDPEQMDLFGDGAASEETTSSAEVEEAEETNQEATPEREALPAGQEQFLLEKGFRWWEVLDISPDSGVADIEKAYKKKARQIHPDTTEGDADKMVVLNLAREEAIKATVIPEEAASNESSEVTDY